MNFKCFVLTLVLGIPAGVDAHAQILVGDLSSPNEYSGPIFSSGEPAQGDWFGMPFETDNHSYFLSSVTALLEKVNGSLPMTAAIYASTSGNIPLGPALTLFTNSTVTTSYSDVLFTPTTSLVLNPNTEYIFVLAPVGGFGSSWNWGINADSPVITGPGSMPQYYDYTETGGVPWTATFGDRMIGQVNASVTPEPSTYALLLGGMGMLLLIQRLRKRSSTEV